MYVWTGNPDKNTKAAHPIFLSSFPLLCLLLSPLLSAYFWNMFFGRFLATFRKRGKLRFPPALAVRTRSTKTIPRKMGGGGGTLPLPSVFCQHHKLSGSPPPPAPFAFRVHTQRRERGEREDKKGPSSFLSLLASAKEEGGGKKGKGTFRPLSPESHREMRGRGRILYQKKSCKLHLWKCEWKKVFFSNSH